MCDRERLLVIACPQITRPILVSNVSVGGPNNSQPSFKASGTR